MVLYVYVLQIVDLFITDDKPSYNGFSAIKVPFVLLTSRRVFFFLSMRFFFSLWCFGLHYMINEKSQYHLILTEDKQVL